MKRNRSWVNLVGTVSLLLCMLDGNAVRATSDYVIRADDKLKIKNMTRVYLPDDKSSVGGNYGSETIPTTFIADPQGVVRWVKNGFEIGDPSGEAKKLSEQLTKLLAK